MSKKKVIVITGGAGGIGMACARIFKDYKVVLSDYSDEVTQNAVSELKSAGVDAQGFACDITDPEQIVGLKEFAARCGSFRALVHAAGVSGSAKDLKKIFAINLEATERLTDAFHELAGEDSVAVLISSMMGHAIPPNADYDEALKNPLSGDSFEVISRFAQNDPDNLYNFVKRGVQLIAQKNANRWGEKGARIVSVSPGVIDTPMAAKAMEEHPERIEAIKGMTPVKRTGRPEEVAQLIEFLVSDRAGFITGTDIRIDGGAIINILNTQ